MTKQDLSQDTSVRYHLHCIVVILEVRLQRWFFNNWKFFVGLSLGIGLMSTIMIWNAPRPNYSSAPLNTAVVVPLANTDKEIIDTEMTGNFSHGYNFTGRVIATNEPVNSFECSLNNGPYSECSPPIKPPLGIGNWTFEVRSVLPNGTKDPTPAADFWSVLK